VGRATKAKLHRLGITTIGELAATPVSLLHGLFGKVGDVLYTFSNGLDESPVMQMDEESMIKSVGNSTTTPRDLTCNEDVKITLFVLCESVCARMREHGFTCRTVAVSIRDNALFRFERQCKLPRPSHISGEIADAAMRLFTESYTWPRPIRSIGVRCTDLEPVSTPLQLSVFSDEQQRRKFEALDSTVDEIRRRFGHFVLQRACMLADKPLGGINPKGDHIIHPVGFFKDGMIK
jgi:DNA polymerase-4